MLRLHFAINFKRGVSTVKMLKMFFVSVLMLAICSCSTLTTGTDRDNSLANLAIQYATLKVIEKSEYPNLAAAKIVDIATEIRDSVDRGEFVLVEKVVDRLNEEVPWSSLSPADALLATTLVQTIESELTARVSSGVITRETQVIVKALAQTVIDAGMFVL